MTKTDVHLAYQQETGLSLDNIQYISNPAFLHTEQDEDGNDIIHIDDIRELLDYIHWLEEKLAVKMKNENNEKI